MLGVSSAAVPASLRRTNQRTVLSLLLRLGSASRADLAKAAGLSQPTAGKIITELMAMGMVQTARAGQNNAQSNAGKTRLGRPGQLLTLNGRDPRFLGVELGVRETRLAALPVAAKLKDEWAVRFQTPRSPQEWLARLEQSGTRLVSNHLWGMLVSVPGIVDETTGRALFSPNLHWLEQTDLPALLGERFDLPVVLVQEIRALALGQLTAEPRSQDFLLVDFGEGVGGAIVLDGKLYSHPTAMSGELGHTPVPGNERRCGCGSRGCLETLVSRRGLLESFAQATRKTSADWSSLQEHLRSRGVESWLTEILDAAAQVIVGALNVLGLHRVIITGALPELPGPVAHRLASQVQKGALWARFGNVTCDIAPRRRASGLVAAGLDRLVLPEYDDINLQERKRAWAA